MKPAEYRVISESLGITRAFLAERSGLSIERIYQIGLPSRQLDVPGRAASALLDLSITFDEAVSDAVDRHIERSLGGFGESVTCHVDIEAFHAEHPKLAGWPLSAQWPLLAHLMDYTGASVVYA